MEINVTKQQITAGIQECAAKLGRVPTHNELAKLAGISRRVTAVWDVHASAAGVQSGKKGRREKGGNGRPVPRLGGSGAEIEQAANSF